MDCTFCLDCIHACPHDNVGILAVAPGKALWRDSFRSGSRPVRQAPGPGGPRSWCWLSAPSSMPRAWSGPVLEWRDRLASLLRQRSPLLVTSLFYVLGLVRPACADGRDLGGALPLVRPSSRLSTLEVATRFSYRARPPRVQHVAGPLQFHFLASFDAVAPAFQRFAGDLGWAFLGEPAWALACCRPVADWLPRLEILSLDLGLLLSLYSGLSDRTVSIRAGIAGPEDAGALGGADRPPVRGRSLDRPPTHADAWHPVSGGISMRPMIGHATFGWLLLGTWCAWRSPTAARCVCPGKRGGYQITVFTAPTPFRAGPVDISALVQDASTGDPLTQVRVTVRMTKPGGPALEYPATTEAATNKLFHAAQFELPEPGRWDMQVQVEGLHGAA